MDRKINMTIEVCELMRQQQNIRNISVIAHVDHGKSTLSDSLMAKGGLLAEKEVGVKRALDHLPDEIEKGITIKSTSVSFCYKRDEIIGDEKESKVEKIPYLINLIDSPGHVDFSSEVTAALRVTDGALVVVDCVEGVCVQTETVLRQAIAERVRPVLWLNKLDRVFLELNLSLEECYKNFRKSIESVNVICQTYEDAKLGNITLSPESGKVGFGSGLMAWGFTLKHFAKMYSSKFALSEKSMMKKLWGENYWNPEKKVWVRQNTGKLQRGFNQFVLQPIFAIFESVNNGKKDIYESIVRALRLKISNEDWEEAQSKKKNIIKLIMRHWLPVGDALLDMIVEHLPSPIVAQKYRVENLYSGPLDSPEAESIRNCDSDGVVAMYISKMVPMDDSGRCIAFGRVFSGTIKTGNEVRILGSNYVHGLNINVTMKKIQKIFLMMGKNHDPINDCPAGNVCGIMGIDDFLTKSGTLTTSSELYPFHTMKFSVAAIVQVAVEPKNYADLPKLIENLKRLAKIDPLIKCSMNKQGQHIIAGAGELHLEVCLNNLKDLLKGSEIVIGKPIVSFCETISMKTGADNKYPKTCVSKSANKHNRLYVTASPLDDKFINAIETKKIKLSPDMKTFANTLSKDYNWDVNEARKIWSFGCPPDATCNVILDMTTGAQYLQECKDYIIGGFMEATNYGVLCDEVVRGIRYDLDDVKLHSDPAHRGQGQISPCARSAFYACQIASGPKLLEPVYLVDITAPQQRINGVFQTLNQKRGKFENMEDCSGGSIVKIQGFLPALESFGFIELLRKNTGGQAFAQLKFNHWQQVIGDPMIEGTPAYQIMMDVRKRKGLKEQIPIFSDYYVKIP